MALSSTSEPQAASHRRMGWPIAGRRRNPGWGWDAEQSFSEDWRLRLEDGTDRRRTAGTRCPLPRCHRRASCRRTIGTGGLSVGGRIAPAHARVRRKTRFAYPEGIPKRSRSPAGCGRADMTGKSSGRLEMTAPRLLPPFLNHARAETSSENIALKARSVMFVVCSDSWGVGKSTRGLRLVLLTTLNRKAS